MQAQADPLLSLSEAPVQFLAPEAAPSPLCVAPGEPVMLSCELSRAGALVFWSHNGKPVQEGGGLELHAEGPRRILCIQAAEPAHTGLYTCQFRDAPGAPSLNFTIQVTGKYSLGRNPRVSLLLLPCTLLVPPFLVPFPILLPTALHIALEPLPPSDPKLCPHRAPRAGGGPRGGPDKSSQHPRQGPGAGGAPLWVWGCCALVQGRGATGQPGAGAAGAGRGKAGAAGAGGTERRRWGVPVRCTPRQPHLPCQRGR